MLTFNHPFRAALAITYQSQSKDNLQLILFNVTVVVNVYSYAWLGCFLMQLMHVFFQCSRERGCWFSDKNNQSFERDKQASGEKQEKKMILSSWENELNSLTNKENSVKQVSSLYLLSLYLFKWMSYSLIYSPVPSACSRKRKTLWHEKWACLMRRKVYCCVCV